MGVRRAMELVLTEANRQKERIYTFGPLIHNPQALDLLASKGVAAVDGLDEVEAGTIVIRAHGIPPRVRQAVKGTGLKIIDATCPKVVRVQAIIRYHTKKGETAVIVGNEDHPEVIGLLGYSETPAHVIQSVEEVADLPQLENAFVVAQTTQNAQKYLEIVSALKDRFSEIHVFHTICDATLHRQEEVRSLVDQVDGMVVVGGFQSGNTVRLSQVSEEAGLKTLHVETDQDLNEEWLSEMKVVGVTAGASTPNWMIKNVVRKIEGTRGRKDASIYLRLRKVFKVLLANNFIVSTGAFCFAYAAGVLAETNPDFRFPLLAFLYVYAMHAINRLLDKGASAYNDPDRAAFLKNHQNLMITTGMGAVALGLTLAYFIGMSTFLALCGLSVLGIAYSLPLIPEKLRSGFSYYKIKHIPGSKSLSEALAWVAVIALLPLLEMEKIHGSAVVVSFLYVFSMSYTRAIFFDIFQAQGDLIVGAETLAISLGEKKTLILAKGILMSILVILVVAAIFSFVGLFSCLILLSVLSLYLCLLAYERRWLYTGTGFEALVEGNFFLAGFLALIWQMS